MHSRFAARSNRVSTIGEMPAMPTRLLPPVALAAAAFALAACAPLAPPDMRMGAAGSRPVVAATPYTAVERAFVLNIATRNVYEIEVSKLAAGKALSPAVRQYAQNMVTEHSQMNDELVAMMGAHGVAPPAGLPADKTTKLHRLAALPRSDAFDDGYMRVVGIEDHRATIAMFEKARREVRDRELRAFIDRSLTSLRLHLATAQSVAASLSG